MLRLTRPLGVFTCATCALSLLAAAPARADGTFLQFDLAPEASDGVAAITRGRINYGLNYSKYEGGSSGGGSVTYSFPIEGAGTFKTGPSVTRSLGDGDETFRLGLKASYEQYVPTDSGFIYYLGEYNTIDHNWFAVIQFGMTPKLSMEFSAGGSDNYDAATFGISHKIGNSPYSFRAGYKFIAEEVYIGLSVNTF